MGSEFEPSSYLDQATVAKWKTLSDLIPHLRSSGLFTLQEDIEAAVIISHEETIYDDIDKQDKIQRVNNKNNSVLAKTQFILDGSLVSRFQLLLETKSRILAIVTIRELAVQNWRSMWSNKIGQGQKV